MRIFRLLASHPIFLFKLNKSGFDECYQSAIKWGFEKSKSQYFQGFAGPHIHFLLIPTLHSCYKTFKVEIDLATAQQNLEVLRQVVRRQPGKAGDAKEVQSVPI